MKRIAFKMKLKPGMAEEYRLKHDAIWPELKILLKQNGVSEYSIFLDQETHCLFAFQKVNGKGNSQDLGREEVVRKWWKYMSDLMLVNEDGSPVTLELDEVFYLD